MQSSVFLHNITKHFPGGVVANREVSCEVRAGEILGVAGISGNGQDELVAAITGASTYDGELHFAEGLNAHDAAHQIGYIPSDRMGVGVAPSLPVRDNLMLKDYARPPFSLGPLLRMSRLEGAACKLIAGFSIRPAAPDKRTSLLSGGNIQKVILARELSHRPGLIVAVTPTAGLDVETLRFVHREIVRRAEEGAGVLLVSEDLDELFALSDRILVIYAGRNVATVDNDPEKLKEIGMMMSGLRGSAPRAA
jgi:simple sugar transport system ATP-binding protein